MGRTLKKFSCYAGNGFWFLLLFNEHFLLTNGLSGFRLNNFIWIRQINSDPEPQHGYFVKEGETALHRACKCCHYPVVRELLQYIHGFIGTCKDYVTRKNIRQEMNANGGGNESTLKEKEVNEVGYYGQLKTIFLVSIEFLNLRNLKNYLFCFCTRGETALHYAAMVSRSLLHYPEEDRNIVRLLMDNQADITIQTINTQVRLLMVNQSDITIQNNNTQVRLLMVNQADITIQTINTQVRLLIDIQADINIQTINTQVRLLMDIQADINIQAINTQVSQGKVRYIAILMHRSLGRNC